MDNSQIHSAEINMYLRANDSSFEVAGCLANTCTLREPADLEPCEAELVIVIDGQERRKRIFLQDGISQESKDVSFSSIPPQVEMSAT